MKTIPMNELKQGDIFCFELKLNGREAFLVKEVKEKTVVCTSRNENVKHEKYKKIINKKKNGNCILLRNIND